MVLSLSKPSKRLAFWRSAFQAVLGEQSKVVCVRFGHDFSPECMKMDEVRRDVSGRIGSYCLTLSKSLFSGQTC